jgi:protein-histidine N-methyltransferase
MTSMAFSFGFSGDDIEPEAELKTPAAPSISSPNPAPAAGASTGAFPVPGKPQLSPTHHSISGLLALLPSKIAYGCLNVQLDDGTTVQLPRRELWDVRVQLMAEDDFGTAEAKVTEGLGTHDVRTGVYEGGFKSWESSVDLVKVLAAEGRLSAPQDAAIRVIEVCIKHTLL